MKKIRLTDEPKPQTVTFTFKKITLWWIASDVLAFIAGIIYCWFIWNH